MTTGAPERRWHHPTPSGARATKVTPELTGDRCWPGAWPCAASIIGVNVISFIMPGRARQPIAVFRVRLYVILHQQEAYGPRPTSDHWSLDYRGDRRARLGGSSEPSESKLSMKRWLAGCHHDCDLARHGLYRDVALTSAVSMCLSRAAGSPPARRSTQAP
jgi:hypothetical protein